MTDASENSQENGGSPQLPADAGMDRAKLADLHDSLGDQDFREVLETFLEDAPRSIQLIAEQARETNYTEVRRIAHALKSSSALFGALRLAGLCKAIEEAAANGKPAGVGDIAELAKAFHRVNIFFDEYLSK